MKISPFCDIAETAVLNESICAILKQRFSSPDQHVLAKQKVEVERTNNEKHSEIGYILHGRVQCPHMKAGNILNDEK